MSGSVDDELLALRQKLQDARGPVPPRDDLRSFLKLSREARVRNCEDVARWGAALLQHYRLGEDESWLLHEQVASALLECGDAAAALPLVKAVLLQFPESVRARRLQGLYYEAVGKPDRARELYDEVLSTAPHNTLLPKRMAAMHRSCGELAAAVDVLRTYLDHYGNDREAWEELGDVYLEAGQYQQAAFCWEEVLTLAPLAPQVLIKLGDLLATLGGPGQLRAARAYYSQALRVTKGRSVRALYGILYAASQLPERDPSSSAAAAQELPAAAASMLLQLYEQQAPPHLLPVVQGALARRQERGGGKPS